jgi:hypothetical protein
MKRQDWVWAFAKAFGIYLAVYAIIGIPAATAKISALFEYSEYLGTARRLDTIAAFLSGL